MITSSLGAIIPNAPAIQQLQYDLVAMHGYVAQLNDAIQASAASQEFKDRWGVFATEWNTFKTNAATYSGVMSATDTIAKIKDYQNRVETWRQQAESAGVATPGPVPNVSGKPPAGGMDLSTKIILGVLGVAVLAGGAYVAASYFSGRKPAWSRA